MIKAKKEYKKFFQDLFLAFMIGVFFWVFNAFFSIQELFTSISFPYFGSFVLYTMFGSFLLAVVFFLMWKLPWLIHLREGNGLRDSFKIFFLIFLGVSIFEFLALLITSLSYNPTLAINNSLNSSNFSG